MKIRALIGVWLVALMGLAMCGAGLPDIGLSSNRGKMDVGLKTSLANGGGNAGWDTVTLVMTTEALSDSAGYDHGAMRYPPNFFDNNYDKSRIDALNVILDTPGVEYKRLGEAQGGADYDLPTFAYADIYNQAAQADSLDCNGYRNATGTQNSAPTKSPISGSLLDHRLPVAGRYAHLFYIPWQDAIPSGASIVSASVNVSLSGSTSIATSDTFVTLQMDRPDDHHWYAQKQITNAKNWAETGWARQNVSRWGGTAGNPWSPALADRAMLYDMGLNGVADWSTSLTNLAALRNLPIDITDCVQSVVAGGVNNGIMLVGLDSSAGWGFGFYQWDNRDTVGTPTHRVPYVVVKYVTKKYVRLFPGGKDWAFIFQSDDGVLAFNDTLVSIFTDSTTTFPNGRPGKYTQYLTRSTMGAADRWTASDAIRWFDKSMEIAAHGRQHWFDTTIAINHKVSAGRTDFAATDTVSSVSWDSLTTKYNSAWLDSIAVANGRSDALLSRRWGNSMALPGNAWGPWTLAACVRAGWSTVRCGDMGGDGSVSSLWPSYTDTARAGVDSRVGRMPRDITLLPTDGAIEYIVGAPDNTTISEAQVKYNFRKLVNKVKGQGRGIVSLYVHAFKNSDYNAGEIDPEEMRWILQVVDSEGGAYMTATEYGDWMRSSGTAIDTPPAYGQSAPFNFSATQRAWVKPDGIDNRWIRGVR